MMCEAATALYVRVERRRRTVTHFLMIIAFFALFAYETKFYDLRSYVIYDRLSEHQQGKSSISSNRGYRQMDYSSRPNESIHDTFYLSDEVRKEYSRWHSVVLQLSQIEIQQKGWAPDVDWSNHPKKRADRFPSVDERIHYYMGMWGNTSVPLYGVQFEKETYIQRQSTLLYEAFADILVNLYDLDTERLFKCYQNKKELRVMAPYCRDYIDVATLHSGGLANVLHFIGDALPSYVPDQLVKYPILAKVRPICEQIKSGYFNNECIKVTRLEPILLPLNRKRHFGIASEVPENDIPWTKKKVNAVWRGKFDQVDKADVENGFIRGSNDMKYALVSKHLNSSLVDAKFSKHNSDAPVEMISSFMDMREQLEYRYIISIEGNDVSSGLKWMLLSNSVVLTPSLTWESWTMEAKLQPFVHFLPINADMSNVEEMIKWAENHPDQTRLISERSSLFIYDLLFHPDASHDDELIVQGIMEIYENNFGRGVMNRLHPWINIEAQMQGRHPSRSQRFPSPDERVKFYMGKWYNMASISMERSKIHQFSSFYKFNTTTDHPFVASGNELSQCAQKDSLYPEYLRQLCRDAMPEFDERTTLDLKSNSFKRLRTTGLGKKMVFASNSSWRSDAGGKKESKRVVLDDTVKIVHFGISDPIEPNLPIFSRMRGMHSDHEFILWPFGLCRNLSLYDWIYTSDKDFSSKFARAITHRGSNDSLVLFNTIDESKSKESILEMLQYRYIVIGSDDSCKSADLLWMLFSESVILMPIPKSESWAMERKVLQPMVHYLPIKDDLSNVDEMVQWAENNPTLTRLILERSTLFVFDLLLHPDAITDQKMIMEKIMSRYRLIYG